jgi:hypothetical protein
MTFILGLYARQKISAEELVCVFKGRWLSEESGLCAEDTSYSFFAPRRRSELREYHDMVLEATWERNVRHTITRNVFTAAHYSFEFRRQPFS